MLDQEPPIALDLMTKKEKQVAKTFISVEFQEILEKYLPTLKKENKYLIQTSRNGKIDEEALNKILKGLAKRAGINLRGSLTWHEGRRLFLRVASEQGINQWSARMLVGKAVPKDILAYVNGVELRNDFLKMSKS